MKSITQRSDTAKILVENAMKAIVNKRSEQPHVKGTPTGLYDLDGVIDGYQPGNLYVIAGRPGMGKTNFVLGNLVHATVNQKKSAAIYLTTTDSSTLTYRMLSQMTTIPCRKLCTGDLDESQWENLQIAGKSLSNADLYVTELHEFDSFQVQKSARSAFKQFDRLDLFVVDGLQRFKPLLSNQEFQHQKTLNPNDEMTVDIEALLRELKALAVALNCPVVMTWQLGPEIDQRTNKRPTISDLHLTEIMEDAIDSVILLFREDAYRMEDGGNSMLDLFIVRNRNGSTGTARLVYEDHFCRMRTY